MIEPRHATQARVQEPQGLRQTVSQRTGLQDFRGKQMICSFGATRVGPLLKRLRLHLLTDRFLARRGRDPVWEAACDCAVVTLGKLEEQLSASGLAEPLPPRMLAASLASATLAAPTHRRRASRAGARSRVTESLSLGSRVALLRALIRASRPGTTAMKPRDAFAICHEIYVTARELVDSRLSTTQLQTQSKFLWRPDLHPRLVEYVADFARAGERALAPESGARASQRPFRASRMILFRMHYLGGAEYHAARRMLGISELTWADWVDEIRDRVGRELMRAGMFPPGRYFREIARPSGRRQEKSRSRYAND